MFNSSFNLDELANGTTIVHRLHPATKLVVALIAIISNAIIAEPTYSLAIITLFLILLIIARVNFKTLFKVYTIVLIMFVGMLISYAIFLGINAKTIFTLWVNLTSMAMPIFFLMFTSPVLNTIYGLEFLLHPLNYLKLPVNAIVLILTIALSFIPILVSEVQRILYAMAVRGRDIRYAPIKEKIKIAVSVLIPLLISTLNRCETLASAIAVKNYDAWKPRTNILATKWKFRDTIFLGITCFSLYAVYILK